MSRSSKSAGSPVSSKSSAGKSMLASRKLALAAHRGVEQLERRTLMSATIVNDAFTDGGFTNGSDAMDVPWFKPSGNSLSVANDTTIGTGNALRIPLTGTAVVAPFGQLVPLGDEVGSTVTLSMDVRISAVQNGSSSMRFGLYKEGGLGVTSDADLPNTYTASGYSGLIGTGSSQGVTPLQGKGWRRRPAQRLGHEHERPHDRRQQRDRHPHQ